MARAVYLSPSFERWVRGWCARGSWKEKKRSAHARDALEKRRRAIARCDKVLVKADAVHSLVIRRQPEKFAVHALGKRRRLRTENEPCSA